MQPATPKTPLPQPSWRALASALAGCVALGGCAATSTPAWDARFGDALPVLQAGQLIAPDATLRHGQTLPPVEGRSVSEAMHRLNESYRHPPPPQVLPPGAAGLSSR